MTDQPASRCPACGELVRFGDGVQERIEELTTELNLARTAGSIEQAIKWRNERDAARAVADQLAAAMGRVDYFVGGSAETGIHAALAAYEARDWK